MNRPSSSTPDPVPSRHNVLRRVSGVVGVFLLRCACRVGVQELLEHLYDLFL